MADIKGSPVTSSCVVYVINTRQAKASLEKSTRYYLCSIARRNERHLKQFRPTMPIPQTIIASPGASYNSGELHGCESAQQPSKMPCIEDAELSRHRFAFSFDSEHPALRSKSGSTDRRQAVSHRRFATPIPRASHTQVPVKLKYYRGAGSVQENSCSYKKEGLKIDTSAAQKMFEQSSRSSRSNSDENLHLLEPVQEERFDQGHSWFDLCQWQY